MQLVNAPVYGHSKFHDGFRCYLVTEVEGKKAQVIETATLVAGEIDANCLRRAKEYELQPLKLRRALLERLEDRKRWGLEVSHKQVAAALHKLGAGERTIAKIMETAPMPKIVEKRTAKKEKSAKDRQFEKEMVEQKQDQLLMKRIKADAEAEAKVQAKIEKAANGGIAKGSKFDLIVELVCRETGATGKELAEAVGWKSATAAFTHLKGRIEIVGKTKEGRDTRYFGRRLAVVTK